MKHKNIAYINMTALKDNYNAIEHLLSENGSSTDGKKPRIIAVVKADAYGHGIQNVASALGDAGCDMYAVSSEEEAVELREIEEKNGRLPDILILSRISPENVSDMIEKNITTAVTSYDNALALSDAALEAGGRLKIHVKLDTGMNRVGFSAREEDTCDTADKIEELSKCSGLELCGIFTHFSSADDEMMDGKTVDGYEDCGGYTKMQLSRFTHMIDELKKRGVNPGMVHAANSAAILTMPEAYFDAVRAGIILYGLMPNGKCDDRFTPVMCFVSTVTHIHDIKAGEKVSYGAVFTASRDMKLATVSAGYADGFERAYSGCKIVIRGKSYRQVGRICMDQFMVDITDGDGIEVGDRAVLFGGDSGESTNALARLAGTINYEVVCKISKRVNRIPVNVQKSADADDSEDNSVDSVNSCAEADSTD